MIRTSPLLPLALCLAACAAPSSSPPPSAPVPASEESVRPGLNDRFLAEELNVDEFADRFEGESREIFVHRAAILAALEVREGMNVADIGAGTGLFVKPIADVVGPRGRLFAVEISEGFVEHLRARAAAADLDQVEVVLGDERSVRLAPRSLDLAFLCDTYHHVEYPRSTLASIHAALRPDGVLVIVDFERIPGVSSPWLLDHVRAGKKATIEEIEAAGFTFDREVEIEGLVENYCLRFRRTPS